MGCDGVDHAVHVSVHPCEVHAGLVPVDAIGGATAHHLRRVRGRQQCFGWHAAGVEAVAPHLVLLDQRHLGAHLRGAGGDAESPGAGADDGDIYLDVSFHVSPLPRVGGGARWSVAERLIQLFTTMR